MFLWLGWLEDINVILGGEEKISGMSVYHQECEDFACYLNSCWLYDINFSGNPFTWWNDKVDGDCIFKGLDKVVLNYALMDIFGSLDLQNLAKIGLDHSPLLVSCSVSNYFITKPFMF